MAGKEDELPDWERLLAAERHLQYLIPGTVLVGGTAAIAALQPFDEIYRQPNGASPLAEVSERLAAAKREPWNNWDHVAACGRRWAPIVARVVLEDTP